MFLIISRLRGEMFSCEEEEMVLRGAAPGDEGGGESVKFSPGQATPPPSVLLTTDCTVWPVLTPDYWGWWCGVAVSELFSILWWLVSWPGPATPAVAGEWRVPVVVRLSLQSDMSGEADQRTHQTHRQWSCRTLQTLPSSPGLILTGQSLPLSLHHCPVIK